MQKFRGHRFLLNPTAEQADTLAQFSGACRFVYNLALEQRRIWCRPGRRIGYLAQARDLSLLRAEVDWMKEVPSHALQQALRDLDRAFVNFFDGRASFPSPRIKGVHDCFRIPQDRGAVRIRKLNAKWSAVMLPKLGWIKFRAHRPLDGEICSVTAFLNGGRWWISVQTKREVQVYPSSLPPIGLDRGVVALIALSNGEKVHPVNALASQGARLKKAQRTLSRRRKGSNRWALQKARVNRIHAKIASARKDQLHKVSLNVAQRFGTVIVEDLKTKNMTANAAGTIESPGRNVAQKSGLNRAILDKGWFIFETMLAYKLQERGGSLIKVNPAYTSQTCSHCRTIAKESRKSQANFLCVACGHTENADINAAKNILRAGTRPQSAPSEPRKRSATRTIKESASDAA